MNLPVARAFVDSTKNPLLDYSLQIKLFLQQTPSISKLIKKDVGITKETIVKVRVVGVSNRSREDLEFVARRELEGGQRE